MKEKIKLLYFADILALGIQKSSSRSGIFFAAINILDELLKRDDVEVTLLTSQSKIYGLKKFQKNNPKYANTKTLGKINPINYFLGLLDYWKYCCRKLDKKDNIFKMGVRFITIRLLNIFNSFEFINNLTSKQLDNYDAFFSPSDTIPEAIKQNKNIIPFTMLHDATPIILKEYFSNMKISTVWFEKLFNSLNKNDWYFTNSEYTKQDFLKYCNNLNPDHVITALLGANENFYPVNNIEEIKQVKVKYNIPQNKKYIFSLCTLEPRKNLIFAVRNFAKFIKENNIDDLVFVMGGGHWQKFLNVLQKEIDAYGDLKDKILPIGYVDDEDLKTLYSASEMFVYTSLYEGFGMPVLEAMQCGCACITSNVTSIPEVIGDAGIQINPKADDEMTDAYKKMYYEEDFRNQCKMRAIERAKLFSWKKCVDIIVETMKRAINE